MLPKQISYILGSDSITVFLKGKSYTINKQAQTFNAVLAAVKANDIEALDNAVNIRQGIANSLSKSSDKVRIEGTKIFYADRDITTLVGSRIFEMLDLGLDTTPMVRCIERLMLNPSKRATDELIGFLVACSLPITPDGFFLAYKRVNANYLDVHSGTVLNKPYNANFTDGDIKFINSAKQGKQGEVKVEIIDGVTTVSMPRNLVNENKDETCSEGLHFCSFSYLASFSGARTVVLKIDPADVVSIPSDYNNSKGRTCRYQVVDEIDISTTKIKDGFTTQYTKPVPVVNKRWEDKKVEVKVEPVVAIPVGSSLTVSEVKRIKGFLSQGLSIASIARSVGTSPRTVARIRDGETYVGV
jgi:hypothetical protein